MLLFTLTKMADTWTMSFEHLRGADLVLCHCLLLNCLVSCIDVDLYISLFRFLNYSWFLLPCCRILIINFQELYLKSSTLVLCLSTIGSWHTVSAQCFPLWIRVLNRRCLLLINNWSLAASKSLCKRLHRKGDLMWSTFQRLFGTHEIVCFYF
jgi:hypothetical protein